ncbi:MAG: hypothetical protein Q4G40_00680 [Brachybacterium sp.]|nr:hypothetical protein [Brachybacterium sp.]
MNSGAGRGADSGPGASRRGGSGGREDGPEDGYVVEEAASGPVTVSPLAVPLLFGGLLIGFVPFYILGPVWGIGIAALMLLGMLLLAVRVPAHREGAVAGALGTVVGLGAVGLLALLYVIG